MPMGSIDRYVFRTILSAFVLILLSLTAVIWITQILRRIDIITNQGQTTLAFLGITGRLVPILMLVIAPIAIVIAVCYALNKLNGDSELMVITSAGMAPRRVYRPVLGACLLVAAFVAFISAYFAPPMQRQMNNEVAKVRTDVVANLVRPGAFTSVEQGLIFHIRDRIGETQFRGIVIDDNRNAEEHTTIVAEYGQIVQRPEGAFLVMRDGNIERRRPKEHDPTMVVFEQYAFDLSRLAQTTQSVIGLHEMYIWELLFPAPDNAALRTSEGQFRVELHERLLAPIYPLAFGVIAFAVLGFPRTNAAEPGDVSRRGDHGGRGAAARRFCGDGDGGEPPAGADRPLCGTRRNIRSRRHHYLARADARHRRKDATRDQVARLIDQARSFRHRRPDAAVVPRPAAPVRRFGGVRGAVSAKPASAICRQQVQATTPGRGARIGTRDSARSAAAVP
jgi:lipopolysaccharide export system permease protein